MTHRRRFARERAVTCVVNGGRDDAKVCGRRLDDAGTREEKSTKAGIASEHNSCDNLSVLSSTIDQLNPATLLRSRKQPLTLAAESLYALVNGETDSYVT
jgi:hypothetical protein